MAFKLAAMLVSAAALGISALHASDVSVEAGGLALKAVMSFALAARIDLSD